MESALMGAIAMGSAVIALVFLRYWRSTRDRFFIYFALSFGIEAINRAYLAVARATHEETPLIYLIRFIAYALILIAIAEKNWPRKRL